MRGVTRLLRDILADLERRPAGASASAETAGVEAAGAAPAGAEENAPQSEASLGDVVDRLDERGFGLLFFVLALPCCPPFVYLLPQIVSVPMLALAGQMAAGRRSPWFPQAIRRRTFPLSSFRDVLDRSEKYVRFVEKLASPRLRPVTGHGAARFVGALLLLPAASIMVPFPGTNTVPGIGIAVTALGLIERDGILVIVGLLIGVGWVFLLLVLGLEAATIIKDWVSARF